MQAGQKFPKQKPIWVLVNSWNTFKVLSLMLSVFQNVYTIPRNWLDRSEQYQHCFVTIAKLSANNFPAARIFNNEVRIEINPDKENSDN